MALDVDSTMVLLVLIGVVLSVALSEVNMNKTAWDIVMFGLIILGLSAGAGAMFTLAILIN